MAALLVALSVMSIVLAALMPVWKTMAQREKEAELVFRGEQYKHAIGLFQRKNGIAYPPSLDVLVEQRFLRKKYKDPVTGDDFLPLVQTQQAAARPGGATGAVAQPRPGAGNTSLSSPGMTSTPGMGAQGGIVGVASKSTARSLRVYNGRDRYNEWHFVFVAQTQTPGSGQPGRGGPGARRPGQSPIPPDQPAPLIGPNGQTMPRR